MSLNTLAFFAHPDDETMFSGGTFAYLASQGVEVHYLSATRGEGGERGNPPLCTQEILGEMRERELRCAVKALAGKSVSFLGYRDPVIGPEGDLYPFAEDEEEVVHRIGAVLRRQRPDAVITHGADGEYGHPAHIMAHRVMMAAVKSFQGQKPAVYTVAPFYEGAPRPHLANESDKADWVLDITPVREQKIQAAACHRTQHGLFLRHATECLGRKAEISDIILDEEALSLAFDPGQGFVQNPLGKILAGIAV
ncbi:MAG: PIG-L deacetylase family protein [Anaerolineales bacterium]